MNTSRYCGATISWLQEAFDLRSKHRWSLDYRERQTIPQLSLTSVGLISLSPNNRGGVVLKLLRDVVEYSHWQIIVTNHPYYRISQTFIVWQCRPAKSCPVRDLSFAYKHVGRVSSGRVTDSGRLLTPGVCSSGSRIPVDDDT